MGSRYTINPSPWSTSISDLLLFYFGESVSREALSALEDRDAYWKTENDALRSQCRSLNSECCDLNRWLEAERNKQTSMDDEIAGREENERWLQATIRGLEENQRDRKQEFDRVWNEKALLEEELQDVGRRLAKVEEDRTIEVLKKDEEIDRVLKEKAGAISELLRRNEVLEEEKREMKAEIVSLNKAVSKKVSEARKLFREIEVLEEEKREMKAEVVTLNKAVSNKVFEARKLFREIEALKLEKGGMEADRCQLKSEKNSGVGRIPQLANAIQVLKREKVEKEAEIERIMNEKKALEAQNRRMEEEMESTSELVRKNDALEKEKEELEAEFQKTDAAKSAEIERILNEKKVLEARNKRMEEGIKDRNFELNCKNDILEKERGATEAEFRKKDAEKSTEIERIMNEKKAHKSRMETELKEETFEVVDKIRVLEIEKGEMNAKIKRIMKEKTDLDMEKRRAEECSKEGDSKLVHIIDGLERDKGALEAEVSKAGMEKIWLQKRMDNVKRTLEADKRRLEEDKNKKISELVKRIEDLENEKGEMEAEVCKANKDKSDASDRIVEINKVLEDHKSLAEKADKQVSENLKTVGVLERAKEELEAKLSKLYREISEGIQRIDVLEKEKEEMEAKFCQANNEKIKEITRILNEKETLEAQKRTVEDEGTKKVSELIKEIEELKKEKREMEVKVCKAKKETIAVKEDYEMRILELADRNAILESEKRGFEADIMEKDEMLGDLERAKEALEVIVLKIDREKSKEIERILKEKMDLEDEKRTREDEGTNRIEVLEAKICQAKQEKTEEIQRILNEKKAVKEDYEKKISELVDRNDILEREKRRFEADILERDEVIKVLKQEKSCLDDMRKELEMEINGLPSKSMEDVHLTNNVVSLSNPRQNRDEMTHTNACKRKRSITKCEEMGEEILKPAREPMLVPCEKNTEMNSTRCAYGSNGHGRDIQVDQDMLDAFDADPELCLKAVCALYRQHTRLADSANTPLSPGARGFQPEYSSEGIALAEYLISEDPEGRKMKKMVAKLEKFDRDAIGLCINIAKHHYKQVFDIYKRKEDPHFLF